MGLFDVFSGSDAQNAANAQAGGFATGLAQLSGQIDKGNNALQTNYSAGLAPIAANTNTAQAGWNAYGNALGLNGQAGSDAAVKAFQANPGYTFGLNQGLDAVMARAAQTGQLASGNTDIALNNWAQNYANQNWQQYLSNLAPYGNQAITSGGQQLQGYGNLGTALNANYNTLGNASYGAAVGTGNAQAQADYANLNASQNMWNMIGGVAKAAAGGAGGAFAPGGFGTQLAGAFNPDNYKGIQ